MLKQEIALLEEPFWRFGFIAQTTAPNLRKSRSREVHLRGSANSASQLLLLMNLNSYAVKLLENIAKSDISGMVDSSRLAGDQIPPEQCVPNDETMRILRIFPLSHHKNLSKSESKIRSLVEIFGLTAMPV